VLDGKDARLPYPLLQSLNTEVNKVPLKRINPHPANRLSRTGTCIWSVAVLNVAKTPFVGAKVFVYTLRFYQPALGILGALRTIRQGLLSKPEIALKDGVEIGHAVLEPKLREFLDGRASSVGFFLGIIQLVEKSVEVHS
jgi:hypothetical protein